MDFISKTEGCGAEMQVPRERRLFAPVRGQIMRRRCRPLFPPIILSNMIYDRLFAWWTVERQGVRACTHVCSVRAPPGVVTYLQMALGCGGTRGHDALVN